MWGGKRAHSYLLLTKIVIPQELQKNLEWYHHTMCQPRETRTEPTIVQHFYWKKLRKTVQEVCSKCHTCQFCKRGKRNYGKLPVKKAESTPWETLCVVLIGKYKFKAKGGGNQYKMKTKNGDMVFLHYKLD